MYMSIISAKRNAYEVVPVIVPAGLAEIVDKKEHDANELMQKMYDEGKTPDDYMRAFVKLMKDGCNGTEDENGTTQVFVGSYPQQDDHCCDCEDCEGCEEECNTPNGSTRIVDMRHYQ
jgi:hypothetical protein